MRIFVAILIAILGIAILGGVANAAPDGDPSDGPVSARLISADDLNLTQGEALSKTRLSADPVNGEQTLSVYLPDGSGSIRLQANTVRGDGNTLSTLWTEDKLDPKNPVKQAPEVNTTASDAPAYVIPVNPKFIAANDANCSCNQTDGKTNYRLVIGNADGTTAVYAMSIVHGEHPLLVTRPLNGSETATPLSFR